jgi:hypothetical protein
MEPTVPRDYKYFQLIQGKSKMKALLDAIKAVRSEPLKPVAIAFGANLDRLKNLAVTGAEIAHQSRRDAAWLFYAEYLVNGKIVKPFSGESPANNKAVLEKFDDLLKSFVTGLDDNKVGLLIERLGVSMIETMLKATPGMTKSMEALLSSMVIGYWAAFEALAPDLWKAAVNNGPPELAQRVQIATQGKSDSKIAEHVKENVRLDPRKDWAGSLIEVSTVSFRTLDRIARWYSVTFEGRARQIFKDNQDIYALAAYRNALIHSSERVDKDFIKQIEAVDDLRGKFTEGETLELDGAFVQRLREAAMSTGLKLIQLADDILSPAAPPTDVVPAS